MSCYEKMYCRLFNSITDALELLKQGDETGAERLLMKAQLDCEEMYIEWEETQ